jgi:hypothetical protein
MLEDNSIVFGVLFVLCIVSCCAVFQLVAIVITQPVTMAHVSMDSTHSLAPAMRDMMVPCAREVSLIICLVWCR